jgi:hypothetical protein
VLQINWLVDAGTSTAQTLEESQDQGVTKQGGDSSS